MSQLPLPVGKQEFHDGNSWFALASENWVLNNLKYLAPCLIATTANLISTYDNGVNGVGATLTNSVAKGVFGNDGVTPTVGDRILVKDQTVPAQNGIYTLTNAGSTTTNWVLTRASDYDVKAQMTRGDIVSVISGTVNNTSLWMMVSVVNTIGTDAINFAKTDQNSFTSIVGTANQINVTVVGGVATISLVNNPILPGTASVTIPTGTTAQRPATPAVGMFRFNTSL